MEEGDAGPFIERLVDFLQGKTHALIGGLAVRAYVRVRPTKDFDVMIDARHWTEMRSFLAREGAESVGAVEDTFLYTFPSFRMDVDVRLANTPLDREAVASVVERPYHGKTLRVVDPAHLATMKVKAFEERRGTPKGEQAADVRQLIGQKLADELDVRKVLERHRPDLLRVLDEILGARP